MPKLNPSDVSCFGSREHFKLAEWLEKILNEFSRKLIERNYLPAPKAADEAAARAAAEEAMESALSAAAAKAEVVSEEVGEAADDMIGKAAETVAIQRKCSSVAASVADDTGTEDIPVIEFRPSKRVHFCRGQEVSIPIEDDARTEDVSLPTKSPDTAFYIGDDTDDESEDRGIAQDAPGAEAEDDGIRLGESANPTESDISVLITAIKVDRRVFREIEDVDSSLDDFLGVEILYHLGGDMSVIRKDFLLLDVSRTRKLKNLPTSFAHEKELEFRMREIAVYTKVFPKLEDLIFNVVHGEVTQLGVPTCFFGQFETEDVLENIPRIKPKLVDAFSFVPDSENQPEPTEIETRAILITHDLEKMDFSHKNMGVKMTVSETYAVIRELAQIHAASWVLQEKNPDEYLLDMFPFLLQPYMSIPIWTSLCETGCDKLTALLKARLLVTKAKDGPDLLRRYRELKGKFKQIFTALIQPPAYPCPSTLLHFDLQVDNIMFRYGGEPSTEPNPTGQTPATQEDEIDVRIHNWKIASVGACTHDLAFLFLSSLSATDRQKYTTKFIKYYHYVFKITAAKMDHPINFSWTHLMKEYPNSLLLAILMVVGFPDDLHGPAADETALDGIIEALRDVVKEGLI